MLIHESILKPFGVLGFPKPMPNTITNVADPMEMIKSLSIEKQEVVAKVRKLTMRWYAEGIQELEVEHGIYEVTEDGWKSHK
jgi:hypothetical protein